jgi:hypothetical protein
MSFLFVQLDKMFYFTGNPMAILTKYIIFVILDWMSIISQIDQLINIISIDTWTFNKKNQFGPLEKPCLFTNEH